MSRRRRREGYFTSAPLPSSRGLYRPLSPVKHPIKFIRQENSAAVTRMLADRERVRDPSLKQEARWHSNAVAGRRFNKGPNVDPFTGFASNMVAAFQEARAKAKKKTESRKLATTTCEKRKVRSEVMHAKGHAGKTGQKPPVFTVLSKLRCK